MGKLTKQDLDKLKKTIQKKEGNWVKIGMSSCGIAAGALEVLEAFKEEVKRRNIDLEIKRCGCQGMCYAEPLVEVHVKGLPNVVYGRVNKEVAIKIVDKHICDNSLIRDHIYELRAKKDE